MAEPEPNVRALAPREVVLSVEESKSPRFTPRELRMVKEHTGQAFTKLIADDNSDDKLVVLAWLKLRRDGYDVSISDLDDTVIVLDAEGVVDPTSGQAPMPLPDSAVTGE